jgi:hypothetical protein
MSSKSKKNKAAEAEVETVEGAEGAATEAKSGGKKVMLTIPAGHVSGLEEGTSISRADYIRKRFVEDKVNRGPIAKELTELQGKDVPYQIVFASTKGLAGGTPKPAKAEGESTEAAA